jgi:NTP pyrophosphatase (non-canonical NTP hydrolase)
LTETNVSTLNSYQAQASVFRVPNSPNEERVMGLLEEVGEIAGVFKRLLRGDYVPQQAEAALYKELGDVLWYLSQIAEDNGWKLSDIAQANLDKLEARRLRNTILGSGDNR